MEPLALFYSREMLEHDTGQHPERVARLEAIEAALTHSGLTARTPLREPEPAALGQITRVHATGYVATVDRLARGGGGQLDPDTVVSRGSYRAALRAAGGAVAAARAVVGGEAKRAFALVRPPGHHARPAAGMGFCLFNNVAVAARAAQAELGVGRLAIVDVDVHHGNGTQESFYEDPSVLFVSTHQHPFYPGTGALTETGAGPGAGATANLPLPAGCGDADYLACLDEVVLPLLRRHAPELLLASVGFDAHWADPLANEQLTIGGYVAIVQRLAAAADELCGGRLALVLEGGYSLEALAYGVLAVCQALRGDAWEDPLGASPYAARGPRVGPIVARARVIHGLG
ncbi:MAG TPA: histone deacetylase [Chloroflexota bacterium]|nr:histone deacetylase [Chloroflexota bacterium]